MVCVGGGGGILGKETANSTYSVIDRLRIFKIVYWRSSNERIGTLRQLPPIGATVIIIVEVVVAQRRTRGGGGGFADSERFW